MTQSFNALKAYYREPYQLNDWLTITQPTIGQIIDMGEDNNSSDSGDDDLYDIPDFLKNRRNL